ncbi:MAG: hypothetical protein ACYTGP_04615 [Planctomycetota bacterium]|jgi:hypothetical protein
MGVMDTPAGGTPTPQQVQEVIGRAREHPLGTNFLEKGSLDSVSATFGVHAFVVDAARESLRDAPMPEVTRSPVPV